ncbi:MAG: hypothetical protein KJZ85_20650, partial [Rhodobacteraceae bacterium]|nr:hypothetical protein [Paracoccaceae bacterium]
APAEAPARRPEAAERPNRPHAAERPNRPHAAEARPGQPPRRDDRPDRGPRPRQDSRRSDDGPRVYEAGPPRPKDRIDPDNPFAKALMALRDKT